MVDEAGDTETPRYLYRLSVIGAPREFALTPAGIAWSVGQKSGSVPYAAVRRVRLSYRPANLQTYRFVAEIWANGAPKLVLVSTSWKSMTVQERLDAPYASFLAALHRRLAASGANVRFERGIAPLRYWPGLVAFAIVSLLLAVLIVRALSLHGFAAAAFVAAFLAFFLWQGGTFFRRNRPGVYRPDALPAAVMPGGASPSPGGGGSTRSKRSSRSVGVG